MKNTALEIKIKATEIEEVKDFIMKTHLLIDQIAISEFVDENGMRLKNNTSFKDVVSLIKKLMYEEIKINGPFKDQIIFLKEDEYSNDISGISEEKLEWLKENNFIFKPIKFKDDDKIFHWNNTKIQYALSIECIIEKSIDILNMSYKNTK